VAARPVLVPALGYSGLVAVALGVSKAVVLSGYASATSMASIGLTSDLGLYLPVLMAVIAPATLMFFEFKLGGGGERVAKMMGGVPADKQLTRLVTDVAQRAGLQPPAHTFEIPSDELNAFAAGFGTEDATVAITSGLRRTLSGRELEAVIAHEIGHIRHSDMATSMHVAVAIAGLGGIYELGRILARSEQGRDTDDGGDADSVLPLAWALIVGGCASRFAAHLMQLSMSRSAEYDADRVAAELCGSDAMISALEKIQDEADAKQQRRQREQEDKGKEPAVAGFRGGVFAHSYISSGAVSDKMQAKKTGLERWWAGVRNALSTHPTTENRIEALREQAAVRSKEQKR